MRLPGVLVAFVLVVLLASTTPIGTGAGAHQFDLLHPLFSHVHLINGRILTHEQTAQQSPTRPMHGMALGTGGASGDDGGLGVSPTVPGPTQLSLELLPMDRVTLELLAPSGRHEAPPDPPPPPLQGNPT